MQSILDDIYYGNYSRTFTPTPEYRKAVSAATKEWDAAKAVLGYEKIDRLWDTQMEVACLEGADDFREGFRLGAALMLGALGER